jgi:chromosome segregation ATPase
MSNQEVILKLQAIENKLQDQDNSAAELKGVVTELKGIVQDLDKDMAIQAEKQSHLFFRIEQFQRELEVLESRGEKGNERQRSLIENALMVVLGGLISYLFSLGSK